MKTIRIALLVIAFFLTACGGSGLNPEPVVTVVTDVTSLTVTRPPDKDGKIDGRLMYDDTVVMTVAGKDLDQEGLTVYAPYCANLTESEGSTALSRVYTCTITGTGYLPFDVSSANMAVLWHSKIYIPPPQVAFETSMGRIVVELDPSRAQTTVNNFLRYVKEGFYEDKIFDRVVSTFTIQGGKFNAAMEQFITHAPIKLEVGTGLSNLSGTIAMARAAEPDSATSQFFINVADNVALDTKGGGYAVFGQVVKGMDVLDAIKAVPTHTFGVYNDLPVTPITLNSVTQTQ